MSLNGISVTNEDGEETVVVEEGSDEPALINSGSTISGLTAEFFDEALEAFPSAKLNQDTGRYEVDCSLRDLEGTLDFTFGETVIKAPYVDWIFEWPAGTCYLGFYKATSEWLLFLLGPGVKMKILMTDHPTQQTILSLVATS